MNVKFYLSYDIKITGDKNSTLPLVIVSEI